MNYYNELDPYAAQWLRNLIDAGHLPAGDVDTRSIVDVRPNDLAGYVQCHFFAGIGGWSLAARLAGWPEDRPLWTGSCPCQPFSVAGRQSGAADERHLWPDFFRLIRSCRPPVVMGEQVAAAVGKDWLDGVFADLEGVGYACEAAIAPACAVNTPHRRDRLWFVAGSRVLGNGKRERLERFTGDGGAESGRAIEDRSAAATCRGSSVADLHESRASKEREQRGGQLGRTGCDSKNRAGAVADSGSERRQQIAGSAHGHESAHEGRAAQHDHIIAGNGKNTWHDAAWIIGHDGKARRVEPSIYPLAHGVPARVGRLRAYGNAIVPEEAAEVIAAWMEFAA